MRHNLLTYFFQPMKSTICGTQWWIWE